MTLEKPVNAAAAALAQPLAEREVRSGVLDVPELGRDAAEGDETGEHDPDDEYVDEAEDAA